jgi:hypothetical protein
MPRPPDPVLTTQAQKLGAIGAKFLFQLSVSRRTPGVPILTLKKFFDNYPQFIQFSKDELTHLITLINRTTISLNYHLPEKVIRDIFAGFEQYLPKK